jgi:hypothetical protein
MGPGKRLTDLSVNVAPYDGRQPASGACPPDKVLRHEPGLSSLGVLLMGPQDAPGFRLGSVHRSGSFLCIPLLVDGT